MPGVAQLIVTDKELDALAVLLDNVQLPLGCPLIGLREKIKNGREAVSCTVTPTKEEPNDPHGRSAHDRVGARSTGQSAPTCPLDGHARRAADARTG